MAGQTLKTTANYVLLLLLPLQLSAAPPYLAVDTLTGVHFPQSCATLATSVLQHDGFAKIQTYTATGTVFAAYRAGSDYAFKVVIKCLPDAVTLVVAADSLQDIKSKVNTLTAAMRAQVSIVSASPPTNHYSPSYPTHDNPDCSNGPVRMRCLNSIPAIELAPTMLYLEELQTEADP